MVPNRCSALVSNDDEPLAPVPEVAAEVASIRTERKSQTAFMVSLWLYVAAVALCVQQTGVFKKGAEDPVQAPEENVPVLVEPTPNLESTVRHETCTVFANKVGGKTGYSVDCEGDDQKAVFKLPRGLRDDPDVYIGAAEVTKGGVTSICGGLLAPKKVPFAPGETRRLVDRFDDDCQIDTGKEKYELPTPFNGDCPIVQ